MINTEKEIGRIIKQVINHYYPYGINNKNEERLLSWLCDIYISKLEKNLKFLFIAKN